MLQVKQEIFFYLFIFLKDIAHYAIGLNAYSHTNTTTYNVIVCVRDVWYGFFDYN